MQILQLPAVFEILSQREIVETLAHQWPDGTEVCPTCESDNMKGV